MPVPTQDLHFQQFKYEWKVNKRLDPTADVYRQNKYKHTILIGWPLTAFFRSCCLFTWFLFFCFVWLCLFLFLFCFCFFVVFFLLFFFLLFFCCCFLFVLVLFFLFFFVFLFCIYFVLFWFLLFLFVSWQYVFNTYSSAASVVCMCVPCLVSIFDTCTHYFCIILSWFESCKTQL